MRLFCIHVYSIISVAHFVQKSDITSGPKTAILSRCTKCGKVKQKEVWGTFEYKVGD